MKPSLAAKYDLTGKTALVTGAARGIGLEIARTLDAAGATLVLVDLNLEATQEAASSISSSARAYALDVTDSSAVNALADDIGASLDILVNNAGVAGSAPTEQISDEHWRRILSVNLDGVFYCCRAFGSKMAKRGAGSIVNIGSMSGLIVNRPENSPGYNASKAGVHMVTKTLACEWATIGVRVNAVAPGYVADASSFMTGSIVTVDGGYTSW